MEDTYCWSGIEETIVDRSSGCNLVHNQAYALFILFELLLESIKPTDDIYFLV